MIKFIGSYISRIPEYLAQIINMELCMFMFYANINRIGRYYVYILVIYTKETDLVEISQET